MSVFDKIKQINIQCNNLILKAFGIEDSIEKSRSGVYANTHENRKLGRVGQRYGDNKQKKEIKDNKENMNTEKQTEQDKIRDFAESILKLKLPKRI